MEKNMRLTKITTAIELALILIKKLSEQLQAQSKDIYRVVDVKHTSGGYKVVIQIIGKSVVLEMTPHEIVVSDHLIEGFSKKDIRTISYYASDQIKEPRYQISSQELQNNNILFKLKEKGSNDLIVKTAQQITLDSEIISGMSISDVQTISYAAGYEHSSN